MSRSSDIILDISFVQYDVTLCLSVQQYISVPQHRKPLKVLYTKAFRGFIIGDPSEARTPDTLLKRQVLCQLS